MSKIKLPFITFEITSDCNLKCSYCYNYWHSQSINNFKHFNSYKKANSTLKRLFAVADVEQITFTGGEPFLAERFTETVLYARLKKKIVSVITNGTLADENKYRQLTKIGVRLFELPIHSHLSEIHDTMTGVSGSHTRVISSIRFLKSLNVKIAVVIVLTRINFNHIDKTLNFINSLGISRIMLNRFNIGGRGISESKKLLLSGEELNLTFKAASETAKRENLLISSNVCTPIFVLNPHDFPGIAFSFCSADIQNRPLTLDINGNMRFCNHSPVILGNIFTDKPEKIFENEKTKIWKTIPNFCSNCKDFEKCRGGCRAASEQLNFTAEQVDPIVETALFKRV
jgi:radical SAM protein with 4Fe4S-binding SPASM domain